MNNYRLPLAPSLLAIALTLLALYSCSNNTAEYTKAENATDAGREFVRAALDGDYAKASFYLYKDSTNQLLFKQQQNDYNGFSKETKANYKESSIRPVGPREETDSTSIFRYYHSANPKDTTALRIVKHNGEWLVDLKSVIKL